MAHVRCYECKKTYDYYEDGFCPRCGAFNQPPRASRIDASGNIIYHEGISEKAHTGSFVHKEYHTENRKRAFTALERDVKRAAGRVTQSTSPAERGSKGAKAGIGAVIGWLVLISALLKLFS